LTPVTGSEIALDTNQAIDVLNSTGDSGTWIHTYTRVSDPVPVVGELRFGALNSARAESNLKKLEMFLNGCTILPITDDTTRVYAQIRVELRKKGTPIPANDVWIAALSVQHKIPLATSDSHFGAVDRLTVIPRP